jgi:hypothetical protein
VLRLAGGDAESTRVLEEALHLYEEKENLVLAERTRALLAQGRVSSRL